MAARGVNKVILDLYDSGFSIPQVSDQTGITRSTVRSRVKQAGILRSRATGVQMAAKQGRLGSGQRGKNREFSDEWCRNISQSKLAAAEKTATGLSLKPSGYLEVTRGADKGRGQHRVIAEHVLGRPLTKGECVHHIDGDRSNNDPDNLQVMTRSEHASHHALELNKSRNRDNLGRYI